MIDIEKNKENLEKRYIYYKQRIEDVTYPQSEFEKINSIDYETYKQNENTKLIKTIRKKMLKQKYNHSLRVCDVIENLNNIMENNKEIKELSMISGLLHDYGRFIQAVYHNCYYDAEEYYKRNGYNGHGEVGTHILFDLNEIKYFDIEKKYYEYIKPVIKYHQINKLTNNLNLRFYNGCKNKWEIISGMIQMVKDADMYDILYQRINGEYPIFSRMLYYNVNCMSLLEISKKTGVSVDEIIKLNNLKTQNISKMEKIKLPFEKVNPKVLEVPKHIKKMFYDKVYITNPNEWDLRKLQNDNSYNYNSITAMWWTMGQFLSNFNFTATLQLIKEERILEKIYELYPKEYKYLVKEMFEFSKEELVEKRIDKGKIYTKSLQ